MLQKVIAYVQQYNMLNKKDKVVIGISGGADSVCLFFMLLELKKIYELELFAVHVNHGIRGREAEEDEEYVTRLADQEGVAFVSIKADVPTYAKQKGVSEEEAGRLIRYNAFSQVYNQYHCNRIAVAHHENDQAETVLFQLFRGSGIRGLAGMAPVRDEIIRPLLCVSRWEIEDYLNNKQIAFQNDYTNFTDAYTRNKIRLNVLPYVAEEINPQAVRHIAQAAGMLREAEEYIEKNAQICFDRIVVDKNGQYFFDVKEFQDEDVVMQKAMLRILLSKMTNRLKDIESEHIFMILDLLHKSVGRRVDLPYEICAIREYNSIRIYFQWQNAVDDAGRDEVLITVPGEYELESLRLHVRFEIMENTEKNRTIPKNDCTKWFDYDRIKNTIFIRNRQTGDFLQIDAAGGRKKLKDYFIDKKIPKEERNRVPLLTDGSHVMWIIGDRISEYYKVREDTAKILIVIIDGGTQDGRQDKSNDLRR